jgi:drug/metabolite transporter (DMT)-like permease
VPGEASALLAAALWAVTAIILTAQTQRIGVIPLNALRSLFAVAFVLLVVPFSGAVGELREMSVATAVSMVGSGILAMGVGDSLYFGSLAIMGAARAVPISVGLYPLLTFLVAALWLDEEVTWIVLLGTALIVVGISLLARGRESLVETAAGRAGVTGGRWQTGVLLVLLASVSWALSTTWLKAGSGNLGPVAAGSVRITATSLVLLPWAYRWRRDVGIGDLGARNMATIALAGVLGVGLGMFLYIFAVQDAGAGKAAILVSTMPLFSLPLAVLFLAERVTVGVLVGTGLCILGIWLVV